MPSIPLFAPGGLNLRPAGKSFAHLGRKSHSLMRTKPLLLFMFLVALVIVFLHQFARRPVTVHVDGYPVGTVHTFSRTVGEALDEMKVTLHPRDRISPGRDTLLTIRNAVAVERAFPVFIIADHTVREIWTPVIETGQLLESEGIVLGPHDRWEPEDLLEVFPYAQVKVIRVEKVYTAVRRAIPFEEVRRGNPALDRGLTRLIRSGATGLGEETIQITYEDGREVGRAVVNQAILQSPLPRVVEYGENTRLERGGRVVEFDRALFVTATAYCPGTPGSGCPTDSRGYSFCCEQYTDGRTYTGLPAVQGRGTLDSPRIVAVDPKVIPLKKMLYIEGIGFASAEDIGGAIKGNRIDLLFDQHKDADSFGLRRGIKVYVLSRY